MKKGIIATIVITVTLIIVSCICRTSFTHFDSMEPFKVALLSDNMFDVIKENFAGSLEKSRNIVKVKCISGVRLGEKMAMQSAKAIQVFKGDDIMEGDEITIMPCSSWIFADKMSINTGFVNAMIPGDEYLVFLQKPSKAADRNLTVYRTVESLVCAIFSYKEHDNVTPEVEYDEYGDGMVVDYSIVKNNEFFVNTKKMDDLMKSLKAEVMKKYQDTGA